MLASTGATRDSIVGSCRCELVSFGAYLLRLPGCGINIVNLIKSTDPESYRVKGERALSNGKIHFLPSFQYHNISMRALECGAVLEGIEIMVFEVCLGDL